MEATEIKVLKDQQERFDYALYYMSNRGDENLLSDLVWTMCQLDRTFFETFFRFCFGEEANHLELYEIRREERYGTDGQNDFIIYTSNGKYIVESKIKDVKVKAVEKYLNTVGGDTEKIRYIVPIGWSECCIQILEEKNVKVLTWNDFLTVAKEYSFFVAKADMILGLCEKYLPSEESVKQLIDIIEAFKNKFNSWPGDNGQWKDGNNPWYGYYYWCYAFFGIAYHPLKGVFFCFTIRPSDDFYIASDPNKKSKDLSQLGQFDKLIKLGRYFDNDDHYFEVKIDNIKNMSVSVLEEAF